MASRTTTQLRTTEASYDNDKALEICELIAGGETLTDVARRPDMPARKTIYRWFILFPEFKKAYDAARSMSAYSLEEKALAIAELLAGKHEYTGTYITGLNYAMQQFRWSAERRNPAFVLKQAGTITVPVTINTNLPLGDGATAITIGGDEPQTAYDFHAKFAGADDAEVLDTPASDGVLSPQTEQPGAQPPSPFTIDTSAPTPDHTAVPTKPKATRMVPVEPHKPTVKTTRVRTAAQVAAAQRRKKP